MINYSAVTIFFKSTCLASAEIPACLLQLIQEKKYANLKMGEFGGNNAHSTLNTNCESGVLKSALTF